MIKKEMMVILNFTHHCSSGSMEIIKRCASVLESDEGT